MKKIVKTKRMKPKLKPLEEQESFVLPCGATVKITRVNRFHGYLRVRRSVINLKITSISGLSADGKGTQEINLGFYGSNIPMLIKILRRAYLIK